MKLDSSNSPIYLPEPSQESVLRLGFENCRNDEWISAADDLSLFNRHKRELKHMAAVTCYAEIAGSENAQTEFHDFLLQHLLQNPDLGYRTEGTKLIQQKEDLVWDIEEKNLWPASLWVAEDICLLEPRDGDFIMTAASVCSPSNWFLEDKIGQTVDVIHAPVPGYEKALSQRVNRFLHGLRSGRVMLRYNWSIQRGNELCLREKGMPATNPIDSSDSDLYWRVERQTFTRLSKSGAIAFSIRIFLHGFDSLRHREDFTESMERLLLRLPEAEKQYKNLA